MCFMYFVVMLSNLKRSFQRRTILNHDAHRLVCLVRILGLEIIPLVMLAAEKSETSSWSWQDSYAEVDAKHPSNCIFAASSSCVQLCWYRNLLTFRPIRFPFRRLPISKLNIPIPVRPQRLSECSPVLRTLACSRKRHCSPHREQQQRRWTSKGH